MVKRTILFVCIIIALAFLIPFLILITTKSRPSAESLVTVQTKYGPVEGFVALDNAVNVFFGIPFAAPPVGKLRFEKPLPPTPWKQPLNARVQPPWCVQLVREFCGSGNCQEDCLYLNIYAPHQQPENPNRTFPVLVLIHGGGFVAGTAASEFSNYTDIGRRYVAAGMVVVAIQYRLSVLGFAFAGDEMPGNFGLWDQHAALQFIAENIAQFGGDPTRITLFGQSAGSASVSMLGLSPHSRDLFQHSVQMSGSPLAAWSCSEQVKDNTLALASALNCKSKSSAELKECMKLRTVDEILDAQITVGTTDSDTDVNFVKWGPNVDGGFLPKDPLDLMKEAPARRTLAGFADLESLTWTLVEPGNSSLTHYSVPKNERALYSQSRFEAFIRDTVARSDRLGEEVATKVQLDIIDFYLKGTESGKLLQDTSDFYLQKLSLVLSDMQFIVPIIWEAQLKASLNWPIFLYISTYFNEAAISSDINVRQNFHTNDKHYLFYREAFQFNANDSLINDFFTNAVINFVKNGDPSNNISSWAPLSADHEVAHGQNSLSQERIMQIGLPSPQMRPMSLDVVRRVQFWTQMAQKYPKFNLIRGIFSL